jgi:hypothetical protein
VSSFGLQENISALFNLSTTGQSTPIKGLGSYRIQVPIQNCSMADGSGLDHHHGLQIDEVEQPATEGDCCVL